MKFTPNKQSWIGFLPNANQNTLAIPDLSIFTPKPPATTPTGTLADLGLDASGAFLSAGPNGGPPGINLTPLVTGMNASSTGSTVPVPTFDSTWNATIAGNVDGTFSMDGYRDTDSTKDLLWTGFPRTMTGIVIIARSNARGTAGTAAGVQLAPDGATAPPKLIELWPIIVLSRSVANMTSSAAVTMTVTGAVPYEPNEDAMMPAA